MTEASGVDLVEGDLAYTSRVKRYPVELHLVRGPAPGSSGESAHWRAAGQETMLPRVVVETHHQCAQLVEQLPSLRPLEGRDHSGVLEPSGVVIEAEQQGAELRPIDEQPQPGDDALGRALQLDLRHRPRTLEVGQAPWLCDHTVYPASGVAAKPALRPVRVVGDRAEAQCLGVTLHARRELLASGGERPGAKIVVSGRKQVEAEKRRGRLGA